MSALLEVAGVRICTTEELLAPLVAMVAAIESASSRGERLRAMGDHRPTGEEWDGLARLVDSDASAVAAVLDRLRAVEGMTSSADRLRQDLRDRAKALARASSAGLRVAAPGEEDAPMNDRLNMPDGMPDVRCPEGFRVAPDGVFKLVPDREGAVRLVRLSYAPMLPVGRVMDLDTGDRATTLAWRTVARWDTATAPRSTVADGRRLIDLADQGAPVTGTMARGLSEFLTAAEACNAATLPARYQTSRMGWAEGGRFIIGHEVLGEAKTPIDYAGAGGLEELADAYSVSGTWEGWVQALELISERPIAYAAIYAALAAPLLRVVDCPSFFVDWSARSGRGKTTGLMVGASCFGVPSEHGLIRSWAGSIAGIETTAAANTHLPLCLDETNRVPANRRADLASVVYLLANGVGRDLGQANGGKRRRRSWRTVVLSTGEARLTEYTQDEGTRGRVISMTGYPLGKHGAELAEELRERMMEHHGHAGRRFVGWLIEPANQQQAAETYARVLAYFASECKSAMSRRVAKYVALMATAAHILHEHLGVPKPAEDPIEEVWRQVEASSGEADRATDALRGVYEYAVARQTSFWHRHDEIISQGVSSPRVPSSGWLGEWSPSTDWDRVCLMPRALHRILAELGHRPDAIVTEWKTRGWLMTSGNASGKGVTRKVSIGAERVRCVVIRREAIEEVGGES